MLKPSKKYLLIPLLCICFVCCENSVEEPTKAALEAEEAFKYFQIEDLSDIQYEGGRSYLKNISEPFEYYKSNKTYEEFSNSWLTKEKIYNKKDELIFQIEKTTKRIDLYYEVELCKITNSNNSVEYFIDTIPSEYLTARNKANLDSLLFNVQEGYYICGTAQMELSMKDYPMLGYKKLNAIEAKKIISQFRK